MPDTHSIDTEHDLNDPAAARRAIRTGAVTGNTAGMAPGFTQGNLAILPQNIAFEFMRYCQRNPKPCPLIGVSEVGDPGLPGLGRDIDIRLDVPSYNVYRHGELTETVTDIRELWRDDFVAFIIGCSYSFEQAMIGEGIPLRHWEQGLTVPMYRTTLDTAPAGPFSGGMVVSMRPLSARDAIRAVEVTSRFPHTHGSPVHLGDPSQIGIDDVSTPHWGDATPVEEGELPVFWACGVTPQNAIRQAQPEICITHTPGAMLITDLPSAFDSRLGD